MPRPTRNIKRKDYLKIQPDTKRRKKLVSGRDYYQSFNNTFGITDEPDGLDTKDKRRKWNA